MGYKRLTVFFAGALLLFAGVHLRLFVLACDTDTQQRAQRQSSYTVALPLQRANFYDRNLQLLTGREETLYAITSAGAEGYAKLYPYVVPADAEALYTQAQGKAPFVVRVRQTLEDIYTFPVENRYGNLPIAVHMLGYVNSDGDGVTGLEAAFDSQLKAGGTALSIQCVTDALGRLAAGRTPHLKTQSAEEEIGMVLTLDTLIQRACEGIVAQGMEKGAVVVQEVATGELLAAVSAPSYNPNQVATVLERQDGPLVNRCLQAFNVGSVFKPMVAGAALEAGYNPAKVFTCTGAVTVDGHTYRCAGGRAHGDVDMQGALEQSCNCYFVQLAGEIGGGGVYNLSVNCGLGGAQQLASGFSASAGSLPKPSELENSGQLSMFAFGQGKLLATPLQIAGCYTMLARDGAYVSPLLVKGKMVVETGEVTPLYTQQHVQVMDKATAQAVSDMLAAVVADGLGHRAQPALYTAAGKTGTAQTGRYRNDGEEEYTAWFAGYYPAENPQYTIVVCLEDGGESGITAAPLFARICDALAALQLVEAPAGS